MHRLIDPFLLVNMVMFFCGQSLAGGRKSPPPLSFLTITGEILILPAYVRSLTVRECDCYLTINYFKIARPAHAFTQRIDDLTGFPSVE